MKRSAQFAVGVGFVLLSLWVTWPLVLHIDEALPGDLGDPLLNTWILGWDADRLRHGLAGSVGCADLLSVPSHARLFRTPARHQRACRPDRVAHGASLRGVQRGVRRVVRAGRHRDVAAGPAPHGSRRRGDCRRRDLRVCPGATRAHRPPASAHVRLDAARAPRAASIHRHRLAARACAPSPPRSSCKDCRTATTSIFWPCRSRFSPFMRS